MSEAQKKGGDFGVSVLIPCQCCGHMLADNQPWFICNECGFRVCFHCQGKHTGPYSAGGYKCSRCPTGYLELKQALTSRRRRPVRRPCPIIGQGRLHAQITPSATVRRLMSIERTHLTQGAEQ